MGFTPEDGTAIAPCVWQVGSVEPKKTLISDAQKKGEGDNVVDNLGGASGFVVDRCYWWNRRWLDSPAACSSTHHFRY
jgi:hypothetical protein